MSGRSPIRRAPPWLAAVALLATASVPAARRAPTKWAVVVGVDQYRDSHVNALHGAVNDARAVARALVQFAEFPQAQVKLLTSDAANKPDRLAILTALYEVQKQSHDDDVLLFYFAGHGGERYGERYLLTYDTQLDPMPAFKNSSLAASTLKHEIEITPARHRILMIDACRTDPFIDVDTPNIATQAFEDAFTLHAGDDSGVRATFLSAARGQSSYEWPDLSRGFFSYFVEKGLSGGAAPSGHVTVTSLLDYLYENVGATVRETIGYEQTPIVKLEGGALELVPAARLTTGSRTMPAPAAAARTVHGFIKDTEDRPLKDVRVVVDGNRSTTTNAQGFFRVTGIGGFAPVEIRVDLQGYLDQKVMKSPQDSRNEINVVLPRSIRAAPNQTPAASQAAELASAARLSFVTEEFAQAESSARAAIALSPDNALAHAVLGNVLAYDAHVKRMANPKADVARDLALARTHIDAALKKDPKSAIGHNANGLAYFVGGNLGKAQAEFKTAASLDRQLSVAHANLAQTYYQQKRWKDAEASYRSAIASAPGNALPYNGLATVLYELGKYGDAAEASRGAIARHEVGPDELAAFYVVLALSQHKAGKQSEALEAVARAKNLGRTNDPAYAIIERGPVAKGK